MHLCLYSPLNQNKTKKSHVNFPFADLNGILVFEYFTWCGRKGAFRRTKNTSQIKICLKFEGGNGLIIWERFSDQSIKNLICQVFVGFPWQICDFSLPFLKLFLVLIFVKEILSKKTWICDKYRCFFVRRNAPKMSTLSSWNQTKKCQNQVFELRYIHQNIPNMVAKIGWSLITMWKIFPSGL